MRNIGQSYPIVKKEIARNIHKIKIVPLDNRINTDITKHINQSEFAFLLSSNLRC